MNKKRTIMLSVFAFFSLAPCAPIAAMSRSTVKKMRQLRTAIVEGDVKTIQALLAQGLRLDKDDNPKHPILSFAITRFAENTGKVKSIEPIVSLLLDAGAKLEATSPSFFLGATPLMLAVQKGDRAVARILLQAGASIDARNTSNYSVLMFAAKSPDMLWTLFMYGNVSEESVKQAAEGLLKGSRRPRVTDEHVFRLEKEAKILRETYKNYLEHVARAGQETETYHVAREITAQGGEEGFTTDLARKLAEFNRPSDQDAVRLLRLHSESLIAKIEQLERLLVVLQERGVAEQDQKDARWLAGQLGQTKKDVAQLLALSKQATITKKQLLAAEDEFVVYRNRIAGFERTINEIQQRIPKKEKKKSTSFFRSKK
jgi:hypothetical protein